MALTCYEMRIGDALIEQRWFRWLLLYYCLFIVYGTFIPFHFSADPEFVRSQWSRFFAPPFVNGIKQFSVSDVISNVLLFLPFGFLWIGSETGGRIFRGLFGASLGLTCLGLLFGLSIEVGQIFSPGRTASMLDVMCAGIGTGIGGTCGHFLFRAFRGSLGITLTTIIRERPSLILLAVLMLALLTDAYYPFEITIDVSAVWENFKHVHWQIVFGGADHVWSEQVIDKVLFFAAIGYLGAINLRRDNVPAATALAWCLSVVFGVAVESGKLFFAGRVPNPRNVMLYASGALLGTFLVVPISGTAFVRRHAGFILTVLVLGLEVYSELSPFDWVSSIGDLRGRMAKIEWVPFAAYYGADPRAALFDLGKKLLIASPLGFLLASRKGKARLFAALVGIMVGVISECCQIALRSRTASITDVFLFGFAAWSGAGVFEWFSRLRER